MDCLYIHLQGLLLRRDKNYTEALKDLKIPRHELYQLAQIILSMPAILGSVELAFSSFLTPKIQCEGGNLELCNVVKLTNFKNL